MVAHSAKQIAYEMLKFLWVHLSQEFRKSDLCQPIAICTLFLCFSPCSFLLPSQRGHLLLIEPLLFTLSAFLIVLICTNDSMLAWSSGTFLRFFFCSLHRIYSSLSDDGHYDNEKRAESRQSWPAKSRDNPNNEDSKTHRYVEQPTTGLEIPVPHPEVPLEFTTRDIITSAESPGNHNQNAARLAWTEGVRLPFILI